MAGIVIYGSQYGTAKQYAEELARRYDIMSEEFFSQILVDKFERYFV
jgi:sulfite reductase alpha subunit-like flavoprotein